MAGAMLQSATHRGKQMKCFADMSKHDDDQTPGAEQHQIPTGSGVARLHVCEHAGEIRATEAETLAFPSLSKFCRVIAAVP